MRPPGGRHRYAPAVLFVNRRAVKMTRIPAAWARFERDYDRSLAECRSWASRDEVLWMREVAQCQVPFEQGRICRPLGPHLQHFLAKHRSKPPPAEHEEQQPIINRVSNPVDTPLLAQRKALIELEMSETKERMLYSSVHHTKWMQLQKDFIRLRRNIIISDSQKGVESEQAAPPPPPSTTGEESKSVRRPTSARTPSLRSSIAMSRSTRSEWTPGQRNDRKPIDLPPLQVVRSMPPPGLEL